MRVTADLHIHSRYSRATSPKLNPASLDRWARIKGIGLLGTGDCTHPRWLAELAEQLEAAEEGFYVLKEKIRREFDNGPALQEELSRPQGAEPDPPRFVLSAEISTIYSREGKTRKVHHLALLPDFEAAASFQARLEKNGNIRSDGRPILGMDSRDLLEILLETDSRSVMIPAHIWTPWFSALGARSGFDSIDACYRDLADHVHAIETGLSSNPPMNWAVSSLDRFAVISNSDAHSPDKLGREATVFDMELSYSGLASALSGPALQNVPAAAVKGKILETLEFFPQEGKYHYDGHRNCGVVLNPAERAAGEGRCPVCGKALTPGVLRRVTELADRPVDEAAPCPSGSAGTNKRPYRSIIPLKEMLAELLGNAGAQSKKAALAYHRLIEKGGSERAILMEKEAGELEKMDSPGVPGPLLAAAVDRMRRGEVSITPGYDGEYGVIRVFAGGFSIETGLFGELPREKTKPVPEKKAPAGRADVSKEKIPPKVSPPEAPAPKAHLAESFRPDPAQEKAVAHKGGPALIIAGPGTGKTSVLVRRIVRLIREGAEPSTILALTFTVKAAEELRGRIREALGEMKNGEPFAGTFHSLGRSILQDEAVAAALDKNFIILDEEARRKIIEEISEKKKGVSPEALGKYIEGRKRLLLLPGDTRPRLGSAAELLEKCMAEMTIPPPDECLEELYRAYRERLKEEGALDFDDLTGGTARLLASRPEILAKYQSRFAYIFADEYQDVNFAQYALLRLLGGHGEICVIGDPNQAIYGFRGSGKVFIDRFLADYPGAALYRLSSSFRCAGPVIRAANRLTGSELEGRDSGVNLFRLAFPSDKAEAESIARRISRLIGGTGFFALDSAVTDGGENSAGISSLNQCAILLRTTALSPPIAAALNNHGIPFRLIGETPWWKTEPAHSVISILKEEAEKNSSERDPLRAIDRAWDAIKKNKELKKFSENAEPLMRLRSLAAHFSSLSAMLDRLCLGSPSDGLEAESEKVNLMTIHASKGLEFDEVFIPGLEEGILPFTIFNKDEDVEEERRLLYVAMTRARTGLYLSAAASRTFKGRKLDLPPSRFLHDLESLIPEEKYEYRRERESQMEFFR